MKKISFARLRRILAMIAALTMLLAALTACSKTGPDTESTDPSAETPPTAATTEPTETTEPTTEPEPEVTIINGTVNTNNLNVRTSPSSTSAILGQLDAGDRVGILEQQTVDGFNWGRTEQGWIRLDFVTLEGQETDNQEDTTTPTEDASSSDVSGTPTNKTGTINATELNIRKGPDTSYDSVGKYVNGDKVTITETKDGWGKTDKGWISMKYVTLSESGSSSNSNSETVSNGSTTALGTVKIVVEALNVRTGPGNDYDAVKRVTKGNSYSYYQKSGEWVRISDGWIYTGKGYTDMSAGTTGTNISGTVTATELNIRKGPDTSYDAVGKYVNGDKVTITETKDGWGKTDKGWISMNYVKTN